MKKIQKRLVLDRETLKHLAHADLVPVLGGTSGSCLRSCQDPCITNEVSGCKRCFAQ